MYLINSLPTIKLSDIPVNIFNFLLKLPYKYIDTLLSIRAHTLIQIRFLKSAISSSNIVNILSV